MIVELLFAVVGRMVVYGAIAFVLGTGVVWFYVIISLLIAGGPISASFGG